MASHQIKEMMEEAYLNSSADVSYMDKYRKEHINESVRNMQLDKYKSYSEKLKLAIEKENLTGEVKIKSKEYINKLSKENIDASEIKKITNSYLNDIQVIDKDVYKKLTESRVRSVDQVECGTSEGVSLENSVKRLWNNKVEYNGTIVYQRNDIIDPNKVDKMGRTNVERMEQGLAPLGPDGKSINLHHMTQTNESAIVEVTQTFHQENKCIIHINPNIIPSGIDRNTFNSWRKSYWKNRANDFK